MTYRTVTLTATTCAWCGVVFGLADHHEETLRRTGGTLYCPNGHRLTYGESEADRLRKRLTAAEAQATHYRDQADAEERAHRATKGHLTRLRKRAANGVCPCCQRTFQQLSRHMKAKHPDYEVEA